MIRAQQTALAPREIPHDPLAVLRDVRVADDGDERANARRPDVVRTVRPGTAAAESDTKGCANEWTPPSSHCCTSVRVRGGAPTELEQPTGDNDDDGDHEVEPERRKVE